MALVQRLTSTRVGTIALASLAALVAGVAIVAYLHNYRRSVASEGAPVTVLVANRVISKGTPGNAVAANGYFTTSTIRESQLRNGAISDPVVLRGRVAARDIFPGQQLTAEDFVAGRVTAAASLTKSERLITIPLDSAHGLIGSVQAGDHVDVFAGFNVIPIGQNGLPVAGAQARALLRLVMQNIPVAAVSGASAGLGAAQSTNVSLRVTDVQAEELAFASDNGKIWLVLRPATGARLAKPGLVTVETMLLGVPPLTIVHALGGR
jgi:Flp pilus assembly protein CpaB